VIIKDELFRLIMSWQRDPDEAFGIALVCPAGLGMKILGGWCTGRDRMFHKLIIRFKRK
jgi:hypothetical protein